MATRKKACDTCHRRKIQCDGASPQCSGCKNHALPCTYNRETGVKKRAAKPGGSTKRATSQNDLAKRMERIEQILQAAKQARCDILPTAEDDDESMAAESAAGPTDPMQATTPFASSSALGASTTSPMQTPGPEPSHGRGLDSKLASIGWMRSRNGSAPTVHPVSIGSVRVRFGKLHFVGLDLGEISSYNGVPFFSEDGLNWIRSRCGVEPSFESAMAIGCRPNPRADPAPIGEPRTPEVRKPGKQKLWQTMPDGWWQEQPGVGDMPATLQRLPPVDLPDRAVVERFVTAFRMSQFGIYMPIIDPVLFSETLDVAYTECPGVRGKRGQSSSSDGAAGDDDASEAGYVHPQHYTREDVAVMAARAAVYGFVSLIGPMAVVDEDEFSAIDGDACSAQAHNMLPQVIPGGSLRALETVLFLVLYSLYTGQIQATSAFHSTACRILFLMGGHTEESLATASTEDLIHPMQELMLEKAERLPRSRASEKGRENEERTERVRRHLRQLYRIAFLLDKELAIRTGLPPSMHDDYCDLEMLERAWSIDLTGLPIHQRELRNGLPTGPTLYEEVSQKEGLEPYAMRLVILKSRTCRLLYSHASSRKTDAELLRDIRELDAELDRWRSSVPQRFRPVLTSSRSASLRPLAARAAAAASGGLVGDNGASPSSNSDTGYFGTAMTNTPSPPGVSGAQQLQPGWGNAGGIVQDLDDQVTMKEVMQHFEYYYLMATIHRASGRCQVWSSGPTEGGRELAVVSSSHALSLQASRSTLIYLRAASRCAQGMNFWMLFFYPVSAMLTIFCNILLMPLDPEVRDDTALLESVLELVDEMGQSRRLTPNELIHLRIMNEFVSELVRLARCALDKAASEAVEGAAR
ncbi:hypothetical protein MAPG_01813 [Magnaporthiopsis poae ATCC 64411]|uniref:Zn(2)-C6 fungal-type domain-containing protein n=1 Tax=Magnaporthiopsis poae (strain ATCC 64411 / 73-15) TaxID=644358 RepID=A0A0C4DPP2_MAGP6|nr:hypothetical protein MAPG_01813 [Magnaporthiopsis poae ATCC 64411]